MHLCNTKIHIVFLTSNTLSTCTVTCVYIRRPIFAANDDFRKKNIVEPGVFNEAIPIKCFVSHYPPSHEGGSVGRAKKKINVEGLGVPVKAGLLSTKAWSRGPFVRNQMV